MTEGRSYYIENKSRCMEIAMLCYRKGSDLVMAFVREMGGWDTLPETFNVTGEGWHEAEAEIDAAVAANDATKTSDKCEAYLQRVERYLNAWREWASKQERRTV